MQWCLANITSARFRDILTLDIILQIFLQYDGISFMCDN